MKIKIFTLGSLLVNCYLVYDQNNAILFDIASKNITEIDSFLKEKNLTLTKLILTHGHIDHILGIKEIVDKYNCKVYIGKEDYEFLTNDNLNLSKFVIGTCFSYNNNEIIKVSGGDYINDFLVIDSPGHTIGSKVFYNKKEKIIITGDTIFKGTHGRVDFPTGNMLSIMDSIKKILSYPNDTILYPGHGEKTTINLEKIYYKI
ncbi:hydroxyacylglutathione hydrolase [Hypnocyclicus thermotrophus]|uniref:Hydroxyacylglutathione hydrolase n=1 Tax=Hypnocyclicus thermotrophus TaxID=1627895 RepID=A0AA46I652_9FUSO|nr:MBL fold metallo-hydrolase [Hypnocyclicus thermotrophus]TDT71834.1 hydroxyacylglutathione hydrolase [Hypnocyclicus thermotrophus]